MKRKHSKKVTSLLLAILLAGSLGMTGFVSYATEGKEGSVQEEQTVEGVQGDALAEKTLKEENSEKESQPENESQTEAAQMDANEPEDIAVQESPKDVTVNDLEAGIGVATVDGTSFASMEEALQSIIASDGKNGTIQIEKDLELADRLTIPSGVSVTVKDNGTAHQITKQKGSASKTRIFKIEEGGSLTIDGNLTFTVAESGPGMVDCRGTFVLKNGILDGADFTTGMSGNLGHQDVGMVSVCGANASFQMAGGEIRNARIYTACSAGVRVCCNGTFTMDGGSIHDLKNERNYDAAPVLLYSNTNSWGNGAATFIMNDGTIENNTSYRGGGVFVAGKDYTYRAKMIMNGGKIWNNVCSGFTSGGNDVAQGAGGGVYVEQNASFVMNDGEISGNTVYTGQGGGVCAACGWEGIAGTPGWTLDLFSKYYPAEFVMNGGTISGNTAKMSNVLYGDNGCGGGIYVASHKVQLNAGKIENNIAEKQGGGVYVGAVPYILKIHNAVVKENHATVLGGGLWACPTGDVELFVTNGAALFDNTADGAGDDLVSVKVESKHHEVTLADRILGGGQVFWYQDGGVDNSSVLGTADETARYDANSGAEPLNPVSENAKSLALKAGVSDGAKEAANQAATLVIQGNTSQRGGGIGTNGGVILGEKDYEYTLTVKKEWSDLTEDTLKTSVTVYLKVGDIVLDPVELNEENQWTASFEGLPDPDTLEESLTYAVIENPVPENFEPVYSETEIDKDNRMISVTVNNKYTPPAEVKTGDLTVKKTLSGNGADSSDRFRFEVTLSDKTINGTYGDMEFKDGVASFTLKGGESKTAKGLPEGLEYEVTETDANQNGYVTTSEDAKGTILADKEVTATFVNKKDSENPENPKQPENPTTPTKPSTPKTEKGQTKTGGAVKTGDENALVIWAVLLAGSAAIVYMTGRKRFDRK